MKAEIDWIKDIAPHRVATMPRPHGYLLEDEISSLKQDGVDVLVSLLTPEEVFYMDLKAEPDNCQACDIEFISFPITDRETPESETITLEFVRRLGLSGHQQGRLPHAALPVSGSRAHRHQI